MKKWKLGTCIWILLLLLVAGGTGKGMQAKAAAPYNLIAVVSEKTPITGKWLRNAKGYRYRDTTTKKLQKNVWLKIKNDIYYMDKQGYRYSGFKKYKKKLYYLNEKGRLATGWQVIGGEKYYFSKKSGEAYIGWQKIGAKKYYFNEKGILQTNTWVEESYVGSKGYEQAAKRIFVGDSRTVGLQRAVGSSDVYIAKWGEGYSWFMTSAKAQLENVLNKNPYSCVIINLGINDMANLEAYIQVYQQLKTQYRKARFYFLSLNPVEEIFLRENGFSGRGNEEIEAFNERMKSVFGEYYIDSYHWMLYRHYVVDISGGCGTIDGLHYIEAVYQMLYDYVILNTV